jgi:quercetin dioxygenase-like cupin family protein
MELFPTGSRPAKLGDPNWFTGQVWLEPILAAPAPSRNRSVREKFEPGARTAWHSHPLGQTLYVTAGVGLIGSRDAPPQILRVGDTIWVPPGQEHWHGAAPSTDLDQIAILESECGFVTTWMAHVSDEEYLTPPA